MNRRMSDDELVRAFSLVQEAGMDSHSINMIGVPGESEETIWETIRLNQRIAPTSSRANVFYPYRGTTLGDRCFREELVDLDRYSGFQRERRASVLKFSPHFHEQLEYFHGNWQVLVAGEPLSDGRTARL